MFVVNMFVGIMVVCGVMLGIVEIIRDLVIYFQGCRAFSEHVWYNWYPPKEAGSWYDYYECEEVFSIPDDMVFNPGIAG